MINADPKTLPDDERMVLNLIFLKYATAGEMENLMKPFLGEGARHSRVRAGEPADPRGQQPQHEAHHGTDRDVRQRHSSPASACGLFEVENSRPSDLVKDLDSVFKAYALSDKSPAVQFIPVDRINTIIAVAPNPGIFTQVKEWIEQARYRR